jgi:hypothetical protein
MTDTQLSNGPVRAETTATAAEPNAATSNTPSEGSWIGRFVALFTPVFAVFAGWFAGWIAREIPGAHLDTTQVTAYMVAAVTAVLAAGLHWLHGWQQHEKLVAMSGATPVVAAKARNPMLPRDHS